MKDAPDVAFLVTSQLVLGIRGERVVELAALPTETAGDLFADRADLPRDTDGIEALVEGLDGSPLAIELAAARARLMSPRSLLERLDDRFALLRANHPDRPDRHTSLEAALTASWEWLDEAQRAAMTALTVFSGPFDVDAAQAVTGRGLDVLQGLVDHSMVRVDRSRAEFSLVTAIRDFAARQGEAEPALERLATWLARFGTVAEMDAMMLSDPVRFERNRRWIRELLASAEWALDRGRVDLAEACALASWPVLRTTGPYAEVASLLVKLADADGFVMPFRVLHSAAQALRLAGRIPEAEAMGLRLVAWSEAHGDGASLAVSHLELSHSLFGLGRRAEAVNGAHAALGVARSAGALREEATALLILAQDARRRGDIVRCAELAEPAVAMLRSLSDPRLEPVLLANEGFVLMARGDHAAAVAQFETSVAAASERGDRLREAEVIGLIGNVLSEVDPVEAARRYERAADVWGELERPHKEMEALERAAGLDPDRAESLRTRAKRIRDALGL